MTPLAAAWWEGLVVGAACASVAWALLTRGTDTALRDLRAERDALRDLLWLLEQAPPRVRPQELDDADRRPS